MTLLNQDEFRLHRQAYRAKARELLRLQADVFTEATTHGAAAKNDADLVYEVKVPDHASVQMAEDGAFVECVVWVPKEALS